jgi:DNA polymerase-3 subunit gamma/tau
MCQGVGRRAEARPCRRREEGDGLSQGGYRVRRVDAPLALYRRYRPDTFAEVIGQDHVTAPIQQALANNRVHHAYLFSGPRGCGKTTSARILARALNCAQAPVAEPCGECQSCHDLARGGPGSIDVIEIDAASHGGVDDARDLRERAFFAPVASRYKVYIIDEAHMVSPAGFNALLKLVEEPPPHLRFIFATTAPDKVIGTIRSRTHHYPFRLVPPKMLGEYIAQLCGSEGVEIEQSAVPLVVRAGGGSVRDTLSVLDQLIGGSDDSGVTHSLAASLLGFTPDALLDEVIDAFSAADGESVFGVVDKVVETGQDPRGCAEDPPPRLRDLVIEAAGPDAVAKGLVDAPPDQAERLAAQAARFGSAELTRAADIISETLPEMRGATPPRLLLELMCARVLLPGADDSTQGIHARLDRLERRMLIGSSHAESSQLAASEPAAQLPLDTSENGEPTASQQAAAVPPQPTASEQADPTEPETAEAVGSPDTLSLVDVRRLWPDVLEKVKAARRFTWIMLSQNSQVLAVGENTLTLGLVNAGARDSFTRSGSDEIVRQAMIDVLGIDWKVEAIIDPTAGGKDNPTPAQRQQPPPKGEAQLGAREAIRPTRPADERAAEKTAATAPSQADLAASPDDPAPPEDALGHDELLARELGAEVIEEITNESPG